jgi:hypothetical protein
MVLAALAASGSLDAQDVMRTRTITGTVMDSLNGRGLPDATVYLDGSRDQHRTGNNGRFTIHDVPVEAVTVIVRRIGYVPLRVPVPASASADLIDIGTVAIRPVATELDRIAVEAEEVRIQPHLADFYRRKQEGFPGGTFITRDEIAVTGAIKSSEVLRRVAKVEMGCNNNVGEGDSCVARNRRGRDVRLRPGAAGNSYSLDRCAMEVWVDGHRSTVTVDEIPVDQIAAVEVYAGVATTPAALGQGRCGVIAFWLRRS